MNVEEIAIDEEFEEIKRTDGLNFPAVTLWSHPCRTAAQMYFNVAASRLLSIPNRIKWFVTTNYVVGLPASENDINSYPVRINGNVRRNCRVTTFPAVMRDAKKIRTGTYRVYKYKDGIAFKRYEQIKEEDNGEP